MTPLHGKKNEERKQKAKKGVAFLSVVHGDHATIRHSHGDIAPQR